MEGKFVEVEKYLEKFIKLDITDKASVRIYFEIRKQKYLEVLMKYPNYKLRKYKLKFDL